MPIEIDLSLLTDEQVQTEKDSLVEPLAAEYPLAEVRRGALFQLLLRPASALAALWRQNFDRLESSGSLLEIEADPTLADEVIVDRVLSTRGVVRKEGAQSVGELLIIVNRNQTFVVPSGSAFTGPGDVVVRTTATFTARPSPATISLPTDRELTALGGGEYGFVVTAAADNVGPEGNLRKDDVVEIENIFSGYVRSYVASDFVGGRTTETNAEMIARLSQGIAAPTLSARPGFRPLVEDLEGFENLVADSVIGLGDPEMTRDRRSAFPGSFGGKSDWYLRTAPELQRVSLVRQARLQAAGNGITYWNMTIPRTAFPGFLEVVSILPVDSTATGTLEIVAETRQTDLAGYTKPDVLDVESAYSMFQTASVTFIDEDASLLAEPAGTLKDYTVVLSGVPSIDLAQDRLLEVDVDHYGADVLVKAPVPCFVSLSFTIFQPSSQDAVDVAAVRQTLVDLVNRVSFTGRLDASRISAAVHALLTPPAAMSAVSMLGRLRYPSGQLQYLSSTETLLVPDSPTDFVSPNTVAFFLEPSDCHISVETLE